MVNIIKAYHAGEEYGIGHTSLSALGDTNITNPTEGQVLGYNGTSDKWENKEVEADSSKVSYRGMTVEQALDEEFKPVENLITDDTKVIDGFWFKEEGVCRINTTSIPEFQSFYIPVEEGKTYYTAAKMNGLWIGYLDEDEQAVDSLTVSGTSITIPTGQNIKYLSYPQRQAYKPVTIISEKPATFVGELDVYRMTSAGEEKMQYPSARNNGNYYSTDTAFTPGTTQYWQADYTYNLEDSVIGIGYGYYILGVNTQDKTAIALNVSDKIYLFDIANNTFVEGVCPVTIPTEWVKDVNHHKTPSGLHGMVRVDDENNYIFRAEGLSDLIVSKSTIKTRVESQSKVFEDYTTASGMVWYNLSTAYLNMGVFSARHRGPIVEKKSTDISNPWSGKSWYAYGTSMTDTALNGYTVELQSLLGANLTNYGKGGSGIIPSLHGGTSGDNTYTRVKRTTDGKTNADLITLEIIPNDMSGTLGTPTDNYADGQTETFCGCLNELLQYLQVNTTAQIVVLIATRSRYNYQDPTELYPPESQKATDWLEWTDAAKECCRRNCVPFIDGQSNCGLGYARVKDGTKYVRDQIHLTPLGAKNLGQYFYSQIKNIPLFYSE